jgi:hypothetical protein
LENSLYGVKRTISLGRGKIAATFGGFDESNAGRVEGVVGRRPATDLDLRLSDGAIVE